jgi:hypothetical protein
LINRENLNYADLHARVAAGEINLRPALKRSDERLEELNHRLETRLADLRRQIQNAWTGQAMAHRANIHSDAEDDSLVHVLYPVPERAFRVLRIIYNETVTPVAIVTAYFDDEGHDL